MLALFILILIILVLFVRRKSRQYRQHIPVVYRDNNDTDVVLSNIPVIVELPSKKVTYVVQRQESARTTKSNTSTWTQRHRVVEPESPLHPIEPPRVVRLNDMHGNRESTTDVPSLGSEFRREMERIIEPLDDEPSFDLEQTYARMSSPTNQNSRPPPSSMKKSLKGRSSITPITGPRDNEYERTLRTTVAWSNVPADIPTTHQGTRVQVLPVSAAGTPIYTSTPYPSRDQPSAPMETPHPVRQGTDRRRAPPPFVTPYRESPQVTLTEATPPSSLTRTQFADETHINLPGQAELSREEKEYEKANATANQIVDKHLSKMPKVYSNPSDPASPYAFVEAIRTRSLLTRVEKPRDWGAK